MLISRDLMVCGIAKSLKSCLYAKLYSKTKMEVMGHKIEEAEHFECCQTLTVFTGASYFVFV